MANFEAPFISPLLQAVIVVDDAERENEGDLIFAASLSTTSTLASVLPVTSGLLCCGAKPEWLERLGLPLLVPPKSNSDALRTAFTVPIVLENLS